MYFVSQRKVYGIVTFHILLISYYVRNSGISYLIMRLKLLANSLVIPFNLFCKRYLPSKFKRVGICTLFVWFVVYERWRAIYIMIFFFYCNLQRHSSKTVQKKTGKFLGIKASKSLKLPEDENINLTSENLAEAPWRTESHCQETLVLFLVFTFSCECGNDTCVSLRNLYIFLYPCYSDK